MTGQLTTGEQLLLEETFEATITAVDVAETATTGEVLTGEVQTGSQVDVVPTMPLPTTDYTGAILAVVALVGGSVTMFITERIKSFFKVNGTHAVVIMCGALAVIYTIITAVLDEATLQSILWYVGTTATTMMILYNYVTGKHKKPSKY